MIHPMAFAPIALARAAKNGLHRFAPARYSAAASAVDPILLTMLAVNQLGPATMRTVTNGKVQRIEVSDVRVAAIFRAALDEMQKARRTDRLVEIVVAPAAAAAADAPQAASRSRRTRSAGQ